MRSLLSLAPFFWSITALSLGNGQAPCDPGYLKIGDSVVLVTDHARTLRNVLNISADGRILLDDQSYYARDKIVQLVQSCGGFSVGEFAVNVWPSSPGFPNIGTVSAISVDRYLQVNALWDGIWNYERARRTNAIPESPAESWLKVGNPAVALNYETTNSGLVKDLFISDKNQMFVRFEFGTALLASVRHDITSRFLPLEIETGQSVIACTKMVNEKENTCRSGKLRFIWSNQNLQKWLTNPNAESAYTVELDSGSVAQAHVFKPLTEIVSRAGNHYEVGKLVKSPAAYTFKRVTGVGKGFGEIWLQFDDGTYALEGVKDPLLELLPAELETTSTVENFKIGTSIYVSYPESPNVRPAWGEFQIRNLFRFKFKDKVEPWIAELSNSQLYYLTNFEMIAETADGFRRGDIFYQCWHENPGLCGEYKVWRITQRLSHRFMETGNILYSIPEKDGNDKNYPTSQVYRPSNEATAKDGRTFKMGGLVKNLVTDAVRSVDLVAQRSRDGDVLLRVENQYYRISKIKEGDISWEPVILEKVTQVGNVRVGMEYFSPRSGLRPIINIYRYRTASGTDKWIVEQHCIANCAENVRYTYLVDAGFRVPNAEGIVVYDRVIACPKGITKSCYENVGVKRITKHYENDGATIRTHLYHFNESFKRLKRENVFTKEEWAKLKK